jgi:hypothetical protein
MNPDLSGTPKQATRSGAWPPNHYTSPSTSGSELLPPAFLCRIYGSVSLYCRIVKILVDH